MIGVFVGYACVHINSGIYCRKAGCIAQCQMLLNEVGCSYQLSLVSPHTVIVVSVDDRHAEATIISRPNRSFPIIISDLS